MEPKFQSPASDPPSKIALAPAPHLGTLNWNRPAQ